MYGHPQDTARQMKLIQQKVSSKHDLYKFFVDTQVSTPPI